MKRSLQFSSSEYFVHEKLAEKLPSNKGMPWLWSNNGILTFRYKWFWNKCDVIGVLLIKLYFDLCSFWFCKMVKLHTKKNENEKYVTFHIIDFIWSLYLCITSGKLWLNLQYTCRPRSQCGGGVWLFRIFFCYFSRTLFKFCTSFIQIWRLLKKKFRDKSQLFKSAWAIWHFWFSSILSKVFCFKCL